MNDKRLRRTRCLAAVHTFKQQAAPALEALDALCVGTRGPRPDASATTIVLGAMFAQLSRRPTHISEIREVVGELPHDQWALFGCADGIPAKSGLYRTNVAVAEVLERGFRDLDPVVLAIVDTLVHLSGGPDNPDDKLLAIDTSYFDAWATPRPKGQISSDRDATGRIIDRPGGKVDKHYGFAVVSGVRAGDETGNRDDEVTRRFRLLTANADDVAASTELILGHLRDHPILEHVIFDRAFNGRGPEYLERLRAKGLWLHFDLKVNTPDRESDWQGLPLLDGWPFAPTTPSGLRKLVRPAPNLPYTARALVTAQFDERAEWALRTNGAPTNRSARVQSPALRGVAGCHAHPEYEKKADPRHKWCDGKHGPGFACSILNFTWQSSDSARLWQWPLYGTTEWQNVYDRRGAVERSYAHIKSAAGPSVNRDHFRVRGLGKVGVVILAGVIASNLGKIYNIADGDHALHRQDLDDDWYDVA